MHTSRRASAALMAVFGLLAAMVLVAGSAYAAAPYTTSPTVSVSTSNPAVGGTLTITGIDFGANEQVRNELLSDPVTLNVVTADANGAYTTTVTLPAGFRCAHTIRGTGVTTARTASTAITIGRCRDSDDDHEHGDDEHGDHDSDDASGNASGGSSLPRTGAIALTGIGVIGLAFLAVGSATVKRRKHNS